MDELYDRYGTYHWAHSINNTALVVAAIVSSEGDFERAVTRVVMGGWDADSNGATVGGVMGTLVGHSNIPDTWVRPLRNVIRSSVKGLDRTTIEDLTNRTERLLPSSRSEVDDA